MMREHWLECFPEVTELRDELERELFHDTARLTYGYVVSGKTIVCSKHELKEKIRERVGPDAVINTLLYILKEALSECIVEKKWFGSYYEGKWAIVLRAKYCGKCRKHSHTIIITPYGVIATVI